MTDQDWDLLAKTQESLREHMARIKELEAELAKQTALDQKADNARELGLDYEVEQEPVAWFAKNWQGIYVELLPDAEDAIPFYTTPPRKEWVGLTDEEQILIINHLVDDEDHTYLKLIDIVNKRLKEKNK